MKKLFLLLLVLAGLCIYNWYLFTSSLVRLDHGNITVVQGDTLATIEDQLLSGNAAFYPELMYRVYRGVSPIVIKPGVRHFPVGATFVDVYNQLDEDIGPVKVRLPEGERAETFAQILANNGIADEKAIRDCFKVCTLERFPGYRSSETGFEGFLFPDTYLFNAGSRVETIMTSILNNFSSRVEPLLKKYSTFVEKNDLRKVVIIASLLEREARTLQDKRMVAGILYKRLEIGMRLDVDATLLYVKGDWRSPLTAADLAGDSPYNTRKFGGLPPGPIANPGLESLEAAMSPIASSYLYYLNGSNGDTHYAATLEGHVQNKWKYL